MMTTMKTAADGDCYDNSNHDDDHDDNNNNNNDNNTTEVSYIVTTGQLQQRWYVPQQYGFRYVIVSRQYNNNNNNIIIQLINLHAYLHRVNYETSMIMQMYKYTGTAELNTHTRTKQEGDKSACCFNILLKCYQAAL